MAKQTFTTGQVLTAAQMTSLQQTAMGGGSATAKTASYVLVAADAGTTVAMNAAGATTITVNTALFAAGDTVFIQNLGAGACTVTAGTATVATAGSLILPQNDAGILYFTATGASIFYDYIQAGAVSPLTTKGDLYTFSTSDARLAVGTDTFTLVADSSENTGLKWAAPAGGGGMTSLASGSITAGATGFDLTSISGAYNELWLYIADLSANLAGGIGFNAALTLNNDTGSNYSATGTAGSTNIYNNAIANFVLNPMEDATDNHSVVVRLPNYADTTSTKIAQWVAQDFSASTPRAMSGIWTATPAAINRLSLKISTGAFDGGTYVLWGVK